MVTWMKCPLYKNAVVGNAEKMCGMRKESE